MLKEKLKHKAAELAEKYSKEIYIKEDFVQEINHKAMVHNANFVRKQLGALELLNALAEYQLESILYFPTSVSVYGCSLQQCFLDFFGFVHSYHRVLYIIHPHYENIISRTYNHVKLIYVHFI